MPIIVNKTRPGFQSIDTSSSNLPRKSGFSFIGLSEMLPNIQQTLLKARELADKMDGLDGSTKNIHKM